MRAEARKADRTASHRGAEAKYRAITSSAVSEDTLHVVCGLLISLLLLEATGMEEMAPTTLECPADACLQHFLLIRVQDRSQATNTQTYKDSGPNLIHSSCIRENEQCVWRFATTADLRGSHRESETGNSSWLGRHARFTR